MKETAQRYAAFLAGGTGTRFWPLSRQRLPKQLLALLGHHPMLVETIDRLRPLVPPERSFVITTAFLHESVREALQEYPHTDIVVEPVGKNTAAACGYGCLVASLGEAHQRRGIPRFCS